MSVFSGVRFHKSAARREDLPEDSRMEVAFAGRSNAGKSSALNTVVGQIALAHASKTPGRTRLINYFRLGTESYLVDLPGYGFAKVSRSARAPWAKVLGEYLRERSQLRGLVLVADIRHAVTDLDRALLDWFLPTGRPLHMLLSKADKLARAPTLAILRSVRADLGTYSPQWTAQVFSSLKRTGVEEARETILAWLNPEAGTTGIRKNEDQKKTRAKGE